MNRISNYLLQTRTQSDQFLSMSLCIALRMCRLARSCFLSIRAFSLGVTSPSAFARLSALRTLLCCVLSADASRFVSSPFLRPSWMRDCWVISLLSALRVKSCALTTPKSAMSSVKIMIVFFIAFWIYELDAIRPHWFNSSKNL